MRKIFIYIVFAFIALFLIIQFIRPLRISFEEPSNMDITSFEHIPEGIDSILKTSCYDCHSYNTNYPWYSQVMPIGWIVDYDINKGRKALNFSEWGNYSLTQRDELLNKICGMTGSKKMPHWRYLIIHKDAELTDSQRTEVCRWSIEQILKSK